MSASRSGASEDARLEQRRQYPRWLIWRGSFTGDYWAMPPRGHPTRRELISIRDLDELARSAGPSLMRQRVGADARGADAAAHPRLVLIAEQGGLGGIDDRRNH